MSDAWLAGFQEVVRRKSAQLAQCEAEKGDLEAEMILVGSKVVALFPGDIGEGEQVATVVIRLLEELNARRNYRKEEALGG